MLLHPTMPVLLKAKRQGFINRVTSFYKQSPAQFFLVVMMGLFLCFILFAFFYAGFRYIRRFGDLEDVVVRYIFALFFFAIFLMLTFSGAIIAYSALFRSPESLFLMSSPAPYRSVYFISFIDSVMFSSWAFMFLAIPILVAYGLVFNVYPLFYPVTILTLFPFLLIPAAISGILVLLIGLLPRKRRKPVIITLISMIAIPLIYITVKVFLAEKRFDVMQALWVEEVFKSLNFARNPFLPSLWAAEVVTGFSMRNWHSVTMHGLLILSNALMLTMIAHLLAGRLYFRAWNIVQLFGSVRRHRALSFVKRTVRLIPFMGSKVRLILIKDIKTFFRDPAQWLQFLIFFGFIGLYFLNLRSFQYDDTRLRWKSIIAFLNLSAVSMTLATLNSRFVFPQISLEGRKFWVIGLMPVTRREIVMGKFAFAFLSGWIISSGLILLSDFMLKVSTSIMLVHLYTIFLTAFGLAAISVGGGALWPNFKETSPSKIVSGIGGTLNLINSVFFVIVIIFVEAIPFHYYVIRNNGLLTGELKSISLILIIATVFTAITGILFLMLGTRRFSRMEVF